MPARCAYTTRCQRYTRPGILWTNPRGEPQGFVLEAIKHFVECIIAGCKPGPSVADGLTVLRITAAIVEAAESAG